MRPRFRPLLKRIIDFLISPWLWHKAHREHDAALKLLSSTQPGTLERKRALDATWVPYYRTFDHLLPAFVMTVIYSALLVGSISILLKLIHHPSTASVHR